MTVQDGTYVREPDGALLLFHSPTKWNSPVDGLRAHRNAKAGSLWHWRIVHGQEAEDVHQQFHLKPGEYIEISNGTETE